MGMAGALVLGGLAGLTTLGGTDDATVPAVGSGVGTGVVTPPPRVDAGDLILATEPGGGIRVSWVLDGVEQLSASGTIDQQTTKCKVTVPGLADLLDVRVITPSTRDSVGLVDNGLGSRSQNNCNRANGRLEDGERLSVALGSAFPGNVVIDWAQLDVEGKHGASLTATTYTSRTGDQGAIRYRDIPLGNGNDNPSDNGGSDNDYVPISGALVRDTDDMVTEVVWPTEVAPPGSPTADDFLRIELTPSSDDQRGDISLEGGGDYASTGQSEEFRTIFHLARSGHEYLLACWVDGAPNADGSVEYVSESVDTDGDWDLTEQDLIETVDYPKRLSVFRYANSDPTKPCTLQVEGTTTNDTIGASISADAVDSGSAIDAGVLLALDESNAFLRVQLVWIVPYSVVVAEGDDAFVRTIDLDGDGTAFAPVPGEYCESFVGGEDAAWPASADPGTAVHRVAETDELGNDVIVPWCILTDSRELTQIDPDGPGGSDPVDVVIQTQVWDGQGDPKWY